MICVLQALQTWHFVSTEVLVALRLRSLEDIISNKWLNLFTFQRTIWVKQWERFQHWPFLLYNSTLHLPFVEQLVRCSPCSNAPFESNSSCPFYCTFDWQWIIGFLFISNASFMLNCEPNMKEKKVFALFFLLNILLFLEENIYWLNCWNDRNFLCAMWNMQFHFFCSCLFFGGV